MSAATDLFHQATYQADLNAWGTANRFKLALCTIDATAHLAGWHVYADMTNELANGNGYTTGGLAITGQTNQEYEASAWTNGTNSGVWATGVAFNLGDVVSSSGASGYLFSCVSAGTSTGSAPTQTTPGALDTSATGALFVNIGPSITVFSCSNAVWTASGSGMSGIVSAVCYDSTTNGLLFATNLNGGASINVSATNQLTVAPAADGTGHFTLQPR